LAAPNSTTLAAGDLSVTVDPNATHPVGSPVLAREQVVRPNGVALPRRRPTADCRLVRIEREALVAPRDEDERMRRSQPPQSYWDRNSPDRIPWASAGRESRRADDDYAPPSPPMSGLASHSGGIRAAPFRQRSITADWYHDSV